MTISSLLEATDFFVRRLNAPDAFRSANTASFGSVCLPPRSGTRVMAEMSSSRSDFLLLHASHARTIKLQPFASVPRGTKLRPITCSLVRGFSGVCGTPQ